MCAGLHLISHIHRVTGNIYFWYDILLKASC